MTDRTPFEAAVERVQVHELEVDWDPAAVELVRSLADAAGGRLTARPARRVHSQ